MRTTYRILALLISAGVVFQAVFVAVAWFQVIKDTDSGAVFDKSSERNWAYLAHGDVGMMVLPTIALVLLIVAFFARFPGALMWGAITFGTVVLQVGLAFASFGVPIIGALHAINAFAIAGVASVAAAKARRAGRPAAAAVA